jgi:oligopeptidase B
VDEYYWLRDDTRSSAEMLGYLEAENAYKEAVMAHAQALEDRVYGEIIARVKQDDSTVPYRKRGYWYYSRYETGKEYPVYARKAARSTPPSKRC